MRKRDLETEWRRGFAYKACEALGRHKRGEEWGREGKRRKGVGLILVYLMCRKGPPMHGMVIKYHFLFYCDSATQVLIFTTGARGKW